VDGSAVHEGQATDTDSAPEAAAPLVARSRHATWWKLVVGVVFAVLGTLLLVKVIGGSSGPRTTTALSPTSATILSQVTHVPASTYNAVGVRSPSVPVVAPELLHGAGFLATRASSGRALPIVLFVGAEFNSFSAAERWPLIVALSRFGTFRTLYDVQSSSIDFAPNTPTFSFYGVSYRSPYLELRAYEVASDVLSHGGYRPLMVVPPRFANVERQLGRRASYPFVDVANVALAREAALSPITFVAVSRDQVAAALSDPSNPVTQSIVASANYLTATICLADGERPGAVCASRGVRAADAALRVDAR
jgi:hypothetical protein